MGSKSFGDDLNGRRTDEATAAAAQHAERQEYLDRINAAAAKLHEYLADFALYAKQHGVAMDGPWRKKKTSWSGRAGGHTSYWSAPAGWHVLGGGVGQVLVGADGTLHTWKKTRARAHRSWYEATLLEFKAPAEHYMFSSGTKLRLAGDLTLVGADDPVGPDLLLYEHHDDMTTLSLRNALLELAR